MFRCALALFLTCFLSSIASNFASAQQSPDDNASQADLYYLLLEGIQNRPMSFVSQRLSLASQVEITNALDKSVRTDDILKLAKIYWEKEEVDRATFESEIGFNEQFFVDLIKKLAKLETESTQIQKWVDSFNRNTSPNSSPNEERTHSIASAIHERDFRQALDYSQRLRIMRYLIQHDSQTGNDLGNGLRGLILSKRFAEILRITETQYKTIEKVVNGERPEGLDLATAHAIDKFEDINNKIFVFLDPQQREQVLFMAGVPIRHTWVRPAIDWHVANR